LEPRLASKHLLSPPPSEKVDLQPRLRKERGFF